MIALVTDSTCDIPAHVAADAGVTIVPALINVGQQTFRDGVDLTRDQFYSWLPTMPAHPATAAPAPGSFVEAYESALTTASHVISIHIAAKLSGVFNAARVASEQVSPDRIHVMDSGQTSMGLGWIVLEAAEAVRNGGSLEGVLHSIDICPG
jgi:DegV family protein with EDD domain